MTPDFASASSDQQSTGRTTPRSSFPKFEWRSVESAFAKAASCSSTDSTRGGHTETTSRPPYSPNYTYTTAQTQTKTTPQRPVVLQELGASLAGLSIDGSAADGLYATRLDSLDTDSGAADSASETDDVEANTYHRLPSNQRRTNPGINRTLLQGSSHGAGFAGNDLDNASNTAAVSTPDTGLHLQLAFRTKLD